MSAPDAAAPPALAPKGPRKKRGPTVSALIVKAVTAANERGGLSLIGVKKVLNNGGYNVKKNNARILLTIKRLVAKKKLVQVKGSLKINPKPKKAAKKKPAAKKPAAKKPAAKKSPIKKSPKKKAKSPKKAKKPTKPKSPKKPKAAKKAKAPKKPKAPKKSKAPKAPKAPKASKAAATK